MPKPKNRKPIPQFSSEKEEREFWEATDSVCLVDWSQAGAGIFPDLKPSTETISLRLPAGLLAELKSLANQRDVPYQSLLKVFLAERVALERGRRIQLMPGRRVKRSVLRATTAAEHRSRRAARR